MWDCSGFLQIGSQMSMNLRSNHGTCVCNYFAIGNLSAILFSYHFSCYYTYVHTHTHNNNISTLYHLYMYTLVDGLDGAVIVKIQHQ